MALSDVTSGQSNSTRSTSEWARLGLYNNSDSMSQVRLQRSRYLAFSAILFGLFTVVADHGSIIIALPSIANYFESDLPTTQWVPIGYVLAISITLLPMGRLADLVGRKPIYVTGFIVFAITGVMAGFAPSIPTLIAISTLHGLGAGMTQGTAMAMAVAAFPQSERGKVLGIYMGVVGAGSVFGPAAGGVVVGALGWPWVFYGVSVLGLIAMVSTILFVESGATAREGGLPFRFDGVGAALAAGALIAFLQAMTWAPDLGYGSVYIVLALSAAVALAAAFVAWELRSTHPLLDLRLFSNRVFRVGVVSSFIHFIGTTSAWFLMPFYLQVVLRYTPGEVGFMTALSYVAMMIVGPICGRISDRHGRRLFTVGGLLFTTAGILTLSSLKSDSHVAVAIAGMIMQSVGIGAFNPPNNGAILSAVANEQHAVVSGLLNLVRNSASVISVAIATAMVTTTMGSMGYPPSLAEVSAEGSAGLLDAFVTGLRYTYWLMAAILAVGVAFTFAGTPVLQSGESLSNRPV